MCCTCHVLVKAKFACIAVAAAAAAAVALDSSIYIIEMCVFVRHESEKCARTHDWREEKWRERSVRNLLCSGHCCSYLISRESEKERERTRTIVYYKLLVNLLSRNVVLLYACDATTSFEYCLSRRFC